MSPSLSSSSSFPRALRTCSLALACAIKGGREIAIIGHSERRAIFDTNATAFWKLPPAVKAP